jgi:hypothetical protein
MTNRKAPAGFRELGEVAKELGSTPAKLKKVAEAAGIIVYEQPDDKKVRLVVTSDVERLRQLAQESEVTKTRS